jgi:hypothetical protein
MHALHIHAYLSCKVDGKVDLRQVLDLLPGYEPEDDVAAAGDEEE